MDGSGAALSAARKWVLDGRRRGVMRGMAGRGLTSFGGGGEARCLGRLILFVAVGTRKRSKP